VQARAAWGRNASAGLAGFAVAALAPLVLPGALSAERLAEPAYLALAGIGLGFAVRGGMPSAGQGVFVGIGALTAAHLRESLDTPVLPAVLAGTVTALAAGLTLGWVVARLRPLFVAVATWLAAYAFALALLSLPRLSGGAQGVVLPPASVAGIDLTPTRHYELALSLVGLAALAFVALARSPSGVELAAIAQRPESARALGVPATRRRLGAFAAAAAVGGLAGGLSVQLAGVADPTAYGPFLSFELLVAVLIGGVGAALGAPVGVAVLTALSVTAGALGLLEKLPPGRFERALDAVLLLIVLSLGSKGLVPWIQERLGCFARPTVLPRPAGAPAPPEHPPILTATGLVKRFDGLHAVEGIDLALHGGRIYGLIGPNGSGKTTVLRLLSGALQADGGSVELDGREVGGRPVRDRVELGVVRTLQQTAPFPELTALEHTLLGANLRLDHRGYGRALFLTPRFRAESASARARAFAALDQVDLGARSYVRAGELNGPEQRLLLLGAALASRPRVLLLDEPSAGAGPGELARLTALLTAIRARGIAVLLVEHNVPFVRSVADELVVLVGGRVIASGPPDQVLREQVVRESYFGRGGFGPRG
jgi:branched-chain amino acid transport system permease protein